ncbi:tricarballylate utilization protein B [Terrihabitans soli]|uniref:Tricarballylate utilization protein B n=1 Tax=Terrihabitans soli TaxID=708113 RepID=A0A6S6QQU0_9HYPH|nr:tricarballylate utilization 4Fe-4S protein TcuB [Terrihabitans soli]BCJ89642.1 tricarballylate utilization protein B [Terrihabitans soli]
MSAVDLLSLTKADQTHRSASLAEADRLMTVCNSCRYCEGLCAVFPAMEMRRDFTNGDLSYLANLCHSCGACYYDCQFSPPHEFNVNVPRVLAEVRGEAYQLYAWPRAFAGLFERNALKISLILAGSVAAFIAGFIAVHEPAALFAANDEPGAFYRLMPHNAMAALFGAVFLYALVAMTMGCVNFWRDIGEPAETLSEPRSIWQAIKDAGSLRYLDGGGAGCMNEDDKPDDNRRFYHHCTFYGFMLCFASTTAATGYHYLLGMEAPYPWYDLPVVLGTLGGIGLVIGPIGLLKAKFQRDRAMQDGARFDGDAAFIGMLFLTSVTGLLLMVLRATPAMGLLLAIHLGVVFALFFTMPYSKFVHGLYRFGSLVRYAKERRSH